mmetsp:Transcript_19527/g.40464  ORF Transcript_19527/g.40464 Transcript_19527/m.40464 type:complete len:220 (-) Transcript_19527:809-1468(-)
MPACCCCCCWVCRPDIICCMKSCCWCMAPAPAYAPGPMLLPSIGLPPFTPRFIDCTEPWRSCCCWAISFPSPSCWLLTWNCWGACWPCCGCGSCSGCFVAFVLVDSSPDSTFCSLFGARGGVGSASGRVSVAASLGGLLAVCVPVSAVAYEKFAVVGIGFLALTGPSSFLSSLCLLLLSLSSEDPSPCCCCFFCCFCCCCCCCCCCGCGCGCCCEFVDE